MQTPTLLFMASTLFYFNTKSCINIEKLRYKRSEIHTIKESSTVYTLCKRIGWASAFTRSWSGISLSYAKNNLLVLDAGCATVCFWGTAVKLTWPYVAPDSSEKQLDSNVVAISNLCCLCFSRNNLLVDNIICYNRNWDDKNDFFLTVVFSL